MTMHIRKLVNELKIYFVFHHPRVEAIFKELDKLLKPTELELDAELKEALSASAYKANKHLRDQKKVAGIGAEGKNRYKKITKDK